MKRLAVLAVLLTSAPAWSCPDLAGSYLCLCQDGSKETLTITQSTQNGVAVYDYAGSRIIGDNTSYPIANDDNLRGASYRAWCDSGGTLRAQIVGTYYSRGAAYGEIVLDMAYARVGADLRLTTQGAIHNSGGASPVTSEQTCVRR